MRFVLPLFVCACAGLDANESRDYPSPGDHVDDDADDADDADDGANESDGEPDPTDTGGQSGFESGDSARIVSADFPSEVNCGEQAEGVVVVENTGDTTWTREEGFKLGAVDDEDPLFDSGDVRVWLGDDDVIAPGDMHTFVIDLLGPETEGLENTDWQMVHEGVHWFGEITSAEVSVACDSSDDDGGLYPLDLPDMSHVVDELAAEHPDWLLNSCIEEGGSWDFMDTLVDRLRETDERWGYNWKRGVEGDPSTDCVDYHYSDDEREGSTNVYIIDVIVGMCPGASDPDPEPGWMDQTQATADAGTIGMWTGRGRF